MGYVLHRGKNKGSPVKNSLRFRICVLLAGSILTVTPPVGAAFEGLYSLTPPAPGVYSGAQAATNYGRWSARAFQATVNTSNAPARLVLEVPAHSFVANALRFQAVAALSGMVSFDCTTVSS